MLFTRELWKNCITYAPNGLLETAANYAVLRDPVGLMPPDVRANGKLDLYQRAHQTLPADQPLLYLEFGVWKGTSLKRWTQLDPHPDSQFVGFDSFVGLPEKWRQRPAGYFSTDGQTPELHDPRVSFVTGWFNQTLCPWLEHNPVPKTHTPVVHIDADLHSAAIFLLTRLHRVFKQYHVLFDDYSAGEARALRDYLAAYGATFTPLLGRKRRPYSRVPGQVFGTLTTQP